MVEILSGIAIVGTTFAAQSSGADVEGRSTRPVSQPLSSTNSVPRRHPLLDVSAILEAEVDTISFAFNERTGPRTIIRFKNIVAHAGDVPSTFEIAQFGGPLPDGTSIVTFELPVFSIGSRYIMFLTGQSWFYTPIWAGLVFRIESFTKKSVVLAPDGTTVLAFDVSGLRHGTAKVLDFQPLDIAQPLKAIRRSAGVSESDPDIINAMTIDAFVKAALDAAHQLAAPLGQTIQFEPTASGNWSYHTTSSTGAQ